jgi:hypothetical protein
LQKDAKAKRMSVKSLIITMITKYAEWDRYAEKFGFVSLTYDSLKLILETSDDNKITQIGKDLGERAIREFLMFWFKRVDIELFLEGTLLWCKYARIAEYNYDTDGRNYSDYSP